MGQGCPASLSVVDPRRPGRHRASRAPLRIAATHHPLQTVLHSPQRGAAMYNDRPIFWPVFWAVFAALVAFNVLKWGLAALLAAGLVASWNANKPPIVTSRHVSGEYGDGKSIQEIPHWPGPTTAVRMGSSRACINGETVDRLNNGWRQVVNQRCIADSN